MTGRRASLINNLPTAAIATLILTTLLIGCVRRPQQSATYVEYEISFPDIVHHEARITATFRGIPEGQTLQLRMARTSPGRYALHEFAKNVYAVSAVDGQGNSIGLTRPNPHQWDATGHDGTVTVTYTLFGDHADGTFSGFDRTFAHMNAPATYMWARNQENAPITVTFKRPDSEWDIATQLFPTEDPELFTAPNLYYLMDSPTRIADLEWFTMEREGAEIRIALQHAGTEEQASRWAENVWKIVDAQIAVFGELPAYDGGTYTFLSTYLPHVFGDGMEHRNSTIVNSTNPLGDGGTDNLGTMSHEYFHQWNVERIRPRTLEPFDFEAANLSDALWLAEGFTSYYTALSIRRAGITSEEDYVHSLSKTLSTVVNSPGRMYRSPREMSEWATFSDRGVFGDRMNAGNTFISYYTWGSAIGLALDLTLRTRFDTDLDAFMRLLWQQYGKPEIPYELDDVKNALSTLTGDAAFAVSFFEAFIEGREVADYSSLLSSAGLVLQKKNEGDVHQAIGVEKDDVGLRLTQAPSEGTTWYESGLDEGDVIVSVDGRRLRRTEDLTSLFERAAPGDLWQVAFRSRGQDEMADIVLEEDSALEVVLMEEIDQVPTGDMLSFRKEWFGK